MIATSQRYIFICIAAGLLHEVSAAKPASWALWTADIQVIGDVIIIGTQRGSDPGWGVDLTIGRNSVHASVWDDDGDAFFMLRKGNDFCKLSAGSNGLGPALELEIYEQRGLNCSVVSATGGPKNYALAVSAASLHDESADCDSSNCPDGACPSGTKNLCRKIWRAPARKLSHASAPLSWTLWNAHITLPRNVNVSRVHRGADSGWGVDLNINDTVVDAAVWDDDGNAFFMVARDGYSCKISVGSDGPRPGLVIETFEQKGLNCTVSNSGSKQQDFGFTLSAEIVPEGLVDCDSFTQKRCSNIWRASQRNKHYRAMSDAGLWTASIMMPPNVSVTKTKRGADDGWGVDLAVNNTYVDAAVWDDDGDAFFMVTKESLFCKVRVGSDGPGPGLVVETYEQKGLNCSVANIIGGPTAFTLVLSADAAADGHADCDSFTDNRCGNVWRGAQLNKQLEDTPASEALWTAVVALPPNVTVHRSHRGADAGWGVDLKINASMVEAAVWDDDGDAFFVIRSGGLFCKMSIGSDGPSPGLVVETYEQKGLNCTVSSTGGGPSQFAFVLSAVIVLDGLADCDSFTDIRCSNIWYSPTRVLRKDAPASWAIWETSIEVPSDMTIRKVNRGNDHGWGVDLKINGSNVHANIWDTDGDAYLLLSHRDHKDASCKISVGSNGLGPGLMIEVFQQRSLACKVATSSGGPKVFAIALSTEFMSDSHADCDSTACPDGACPAHTSHLCSNIWRASTVVIV